MEADVHDNPQFERTNSTANRRNEKCLEHGDGCVVLYIKRIVPFFSFIAIPVSMEVFVELNKTHYIQIVHLYMQWRGILLGRIGE